MRDLLAQLRIHRLLAYALLITGSLIMILPLVWMTSAAFKPLHEVMQIPPTWIPQEPTLANFEAVFSQFPFARYILNSVIVVTVVVLSVLLTSSMAGYALAKYQFPGRYVLFIIILSGLMVPFQTRMIPIYQMMVTAGWIDTLQAVMFPWLISSFGIFMMRQFILTIPDDLIEAARIDGATELRIFWHVVLPLIKPALAALTILTFLANWDEFLWPLIVSNSAAARTLPVGLQAFAEQYGLNIHWQMAGALIATLPVLILFFLLQRQFVQGIAMTGMKG
jgi:multiple sugar transport system permease protein